MQLDTSISQLTKVGKTVAKRLAMLGIKTAGDLLYYFPFRYEDYRTVVPIAQLKDGQMVTVLGQVQLISNRRSFRTRKMITEALVSDDTGSVRVVWFNQPFLTKTIKSGDRLYLSGTVKADMIGSQLASPLFEKFKDETTHTARLVPVYPLTAGLTQKQMRFLVRQVIEAAKQVQEWLPPFVLEDLDLVPIADALQGIHFPVDETHLKKSLERLKFDELLLLQLKAELARSQRARQQAPIIAFREREIKQLVASLPFALTKAQKIAAWEIIQDLGQASPMNRLLSGDVGSGKTAVAAMASYDVILNGFQVAMMAPTEILAAQHFQSLQTLLPPSVRIALFTSNFCQLRGNGLEATTKAVQRKEVVSKMHNGVVDIVIGTHALLSKNVSFANLALVVVDEQHHFGVAQRKLLKEKGEQVHFLSMTATPIPRSLALTLYGDLDVSILNELPTGRKNIITKLVEAKNRVKAYEFIRQQVTQDRQVFVICPLIQTADNRQQITDYSDNHDIFLEMPYSAAVEKKSVMSEYEKLSQEVFSDLRVAFLHGRMKAEDSERVMVDFKRGDIDILISTSVVEVGVDVPNASIMMIEDADRFGLAQLHQFRGRVGRSTHQSYCFVFTTSPSERSLERLSFFVSTADGFKLAEKDLEMRGPGEVYGVEQSGMMQLKLATLRDRDLIKKARAVAKRLVPDMRRYPAVARRIKQWSEQVHLE